MTKRPLVGVSGKLNVFAFQSLKPINSTLTGVRNVPEMSMSCESVVQIKKKKKIYIYIYIYMLGQ